APPPAKKRSSRTENTRYADCPPSTVPPGSPCCTPLPLAVQGHTRPADEVVGLPFTHADQEQQPIQSQVRNRPACLLAYNGLGMKRHPHPRNRQHRDIICPIAHGNRLLQRQVLQPGDL